MPYVATLRLNSRHEPVVEAKEVHVLYASDTRQIVRFEDNGWETYHGELFDTEEEARHSLSIELQYLSMLAREAATELL